MNFNINDLLVQLATANAENDFLRRQNQVLQESLIQEKEISSSLQRLKQQYQSSTINSESSTNFLNLDPIATTASLSLEEEGNIVKNCRATGKLLLTETYVNIFKDVSEKLKEYDYLWIIFPAMDSILNNFKGKISLQKFAELQNSQVLTTIAKNRLCPIDLRLIRVVRMENKKIYFEGVDVPVSTLIFDIVPYVNGYHNPEPLGNFLTSVEIAVASVCEKNNFENMESDCYKPLEQLSVIENQTRISCRFCNKKFEKNRGLRIHLKRIHGLGKNGITRFGIVNKRYRCQICKKIFTTKGSLNIHKPIHDRPFKCSTCLHGFHTKESLDAHMFKHQKESKSCPFCAAFFEKEDYLKIHLRLCEKREQSNVDQSCFKKDKVSNSKGNQDISSSKETSSFVLMQQNTRTIINKRKFLVSKKYSYKCTICKKGFSTSVGLHSHKVIHSRPFVCSLCLRSFSVKEKLDKHIFGHITSEKCSCCICYEVFESENDLRSHMEICRAKKVNLNLDKLKGFTCSFCPKKCKSKSNLKVHMLTHQTEKPHKCTICEASFAQKPSLVYHLQKHGSNYFQNLPVIDLNNDVLQTNCPNNEQSNIDLFNDK